MYKKGLSKRKVLAIIFIIAIVLLLTISVSSEIKKHAMTKLANVESIVDSNDNRTQSDYVKFDALFKENNSRSIRAELNDSITIKTDLSVLTNGELQNGKIQLNTNNFRIVGNIDSDNYVSSVSSNTISLKTIPSGVTKTIDISLLQTVVTSSSFDISKLSNTNTLVFTGIHVASDGTKTAISKTITFNIDWFGDISINDIWLKNLEKDFLIDRNNNKIYTIYQMEAYTNPVGSGQTLAPDKALVMEGTVEQLQGNNPTNAFVYDVSDHKKNLTYTYDKTSRQLNIRMENPINNSKGETISTPQRYMVRIAVEYDASAYSPSATGVYSRLTMNAYAEGYSTNTNGDIVTIKSTAESKTGSVYIKNPYGNVLIYDMEYSTLAATSRISKAIMRLNYENNLNLESTYQIDWNVSLILNNDIERLIFREDYSNSKDLISSTYVEDTDHFLSSDGKYYDMSSFVSYKGIYLDNSVFNVLGEDGYLIVYNDETNEEVNRFTISDVNKVIKYDVPVKHIRIETSEPKNVGSMKISNYKVIDSEIMKQTYTKEQFETFEKIYSSLNGLVKYNNNIELENINGDIQEIEYEEGSSAYYTQFFSNQHTFHPLKLNTNSLSIQFEASIDDSSRDYIPWKNPTILLEFPESVKNVIYNNLSINGLTVVSTDIRKVNGKIVLKIYTEGLLTKYTSGTITFQSEIDNFTILSNDELRVFANNEIGHEIYNGTQSYWYPSNSSDVTDIYDIDNDGDTSDNTKVETVKMYYSSSDTLVTTTQITGFDDNNTIVEGPNIAKVDKNINNTARINVKALNAYQKPIKNVKIVGRIPFEGNKYVINSNDIGSTFSTTLQSTGIKTNDSISGYTVYYSENAEATKEFTSTNNWTTSPSNWENVKSYMIDFESNTIPSKTVYTFYYDIQLPDTLTYGKTTYATHAIFFDNDITPNLSTEPDKVGLRIETNKKYTLKVKDYKFKTEDLVDVYYNLGIKGENFGDTYQISSSYSGLVTKSTLYPGAVYTIKQTSIGSIYSQYILNDQEISFRLDENNGNYEVKILSGKVRGTPTVDVTNGNITVNIDIENMLKYNVVVRNKQKGTDILIPKSTVYIENNGNRYSTPLTDGTGRRNTLEDGAISITQNSVGDKNFELDKTPHNFTVGRNVNGELEVSNLENITADKITIEETFREPATIYVDIENEYKLVNVNVYYYLKGTTTPVSESVTLPNIRLHDTYETAEPNDINHDKYKLDSIVGEASGTVETDRLDIYYYYTINEFNVSTSVKGTGGKITGQDLETLESVQYGENAKTLIIITPDEGYSVKTVTINGEEYEPILQENGTYTIELFKNVIENKQVEVEFEIGTFEYSVEYYYDNKIDDTKTIKDTKTFGEKVEEVENKNIPGYEYDKVENLPLTISTNPENNIIKVYYNRILTSINAEKEWNDTNNKLGNRPSSIVLQLKNGDNVVKEVTINQENEWKYTFTEIPKFDLEGNEITYTIDEKETNSGELANYEKTVNGFKIVNTYIGPDITSSKKVILENGLDYAVKGEKITYIIEIENSGRTAKDVVVKDTIPTGTEFVPNSIKINNVLIEKTDIDLANGITVDAKGEATTTLSFDVIVNELPEDTDSLKLSNIATVDEKETNETIVTVNKFDLKVNKTSTPKEVKVDDEITYKIKLDNSTGTAPGRIIVKDTAPEGTEFVNNSIKINNVEFSKTEEDLANGIHIEILAGEIKTLEFKVKVKQLTNGTEIRNVATVNDEDTNETINTYIEAIVNSEKTFKTEYEKTYVVEGEKITYTITLTNTGDLARNTLVADIIPEGTEFVSNSIKVNNVLVNKTEEDLTNGIEVPVDKQSTATLSFEVKVTSADKEIKNTAKVDEKDTNETKTPTIKYSKKAEVIRTTEEAISDGAVTANDIIKYTITVNNTSEEVVRNIKVTDIVPTGTTIKLINNNGNINDKKEINWNIDEILAGQSKEVSFEVVVNYNAKNGTIKNSAMVEGKPTNETEIDYEVPEAKINTTVEKTGDNQITDFNEKVNYTINYQVSTKDFVGSAKITIVDNLPFEINPVESDLSGGIYNKTQKTITWEESKNVNTYEDENKNINITKNISLKFVYTNEETLNGTINNQVKGKVQLIQENPDKPSEEKIIKEEEKIDNHPSEVKVPTQVIVHHYIYDGGYTTTKLTDDEVISGIIGDKYSTSVSNKVRADYECIETEPVNHEGTMTKTPIQVAYYYKLKESSIESKTTKTATADKTKEVEYDTGKLDEENKPIKEIKTIPVLTNEGGKVTYKIIQNVKVDSYKGKLKVIIVDTLPAMIDVEKSNLAEGNYNSTNNTITWEIEEDVDTFENGVYENTITKQIEIVYKNQNVAIDLVNTALGKVVLYYPDCHSTHPNDEKDIVDTEDTAEVAQEYFTEKAVEKVWDDNNNKKGRRPESVTVELTADGVPTKISGVLNQANNWKGIFENLPKYTNQGKEITYSVIEKETNSGDLAFYDTPVVTGNNNIVVTNKYKLMNTELDAKLSKSGPETIRASKEKINYIISYDTTLNDYMGDVKLKIVDYLPYEIDESKSNLDGGIYNQDAKTISWEVRMNNIDTYTNGAYDIKLSKNINLVYSNMEISARTLTNRVTATIDLYEIESTNTVEATITSKVEIPGKIIVKYIDKETGNEIKYVENDVEKTYGYEINGKAGDSYNTQRKTIYGYNYDSSTDNTKGIIPEGTIEVTYYYTRAASGGVIVKYKDENGNDLEEPKYIPGNLGDNYETERKNIENYELAKVTGEEKGIMTENTIEVIYTYKKVERKVIIKYLEKETNNEIAESIVINGYSGEEYTTERKEIANYRKADPEPENKKGILGKEDIYVIYYYEKIPSGTVTIKYVDKDTKEEILYKDENTGEYKTYQEKKQGYSGEKYTIEQKQIPYYNLVEAPTNKEGTFTEEDMEVVYYYQKQVFNFEVEKTIKHAIVNGEEQNVLDGKLLKLEVVANKTQNTNIFVSYNITVKNTGEIAGKTTIVDRVPNGFTIHQETFEQWQQNKDGNLETVVELKPGETKEFKVSLNWNKADFGSAKNIVELMDLENGANFEDTNKDDNISQAEVIIGVRTGKLEEKNNFIIIYTIIAIPLIAGIYLYIHKKHNK